MADCTAHDTNICHVSINNLPDEIVIMILSHMSISALMDVIPNVCSRWKKLCQDKKVWSDKTCEIRDIRSKCPDSDNSKIVTTDKEAMQFLCNAPNLHCVMIHRVVSSEVLHMLSTRCHHLTKLHFHCHQELSYSVLKNLVENCTKIHTLEIFSELLKSQKYAETVSQFQKLRVLFLRISTESSPPVLRPLGDGCPQLSKLHFSCKNVNMDDLTYFLNAKRNTLKFIAINWTVSGRCVLPLLTICADNLKCLKLYIYDVVDHEAREAFHALGSLTNLQQLRMPINRKPPPDTIPVAFRSGGLSKLKLLDLEEGHYLDDDTVIAICSGCPALHHLIVRAPLLSDAAFSQIHLLENLEILDLSNCKGLGGALIPYLSRLPRLHTLSMENMEFPKLEPGLSSILDLSCLRCLRLNLSTITGMPFHKFPSKLISLRKLHIECCIGDRKATDVLKEKMPDLQIYGDYRKEKRRYKTVRHESSEDSAEEEDYEEFVAFDDNDLLYNAW